MKVLVPIKKVIDHNTRIRVKSDRSGVETSNVKMSINPFCEIAVEEAIRLKEKGIAKEIIAVTIGDEDSEDVLRTALAMGVDRGILVKTKLSAQPLEIAKILRKLVENEGPELVILGKQSIDSDNNQTGQMLAGLLNWAQGTFVSKMEVEDGVLEITREVDGGLESISLSMPAVVTTDLRLNEPRYIKLPNIMKAKKKPIEVLEPGELNADVVSNLKILYMDEPKKRVAGIRVENVEQLMDKLRNEANVI